ncbi:MAG: DinB family protein [Cellulophaga sp.]
MSKDNFSIKKSIEILESTPSVLKGLLKGKSESWTLNNEGKDTWSPVQVLRHLILAEINNWIPRIEIILSNEHDKTYIPFERQEKVFREQSITELLAEFTVYRIINIKKLKSKNITKADFNKTAIHPEFGEVTLSQQISTWCVHDLGHISQICRVMAFQYKNEIGPWEKYLSIVKTK